MNVFAIPSHFAARFPLTKRSEALDCSGRKMRTQCDRVITFHDERDYDGTVEIVLHNGKETGTDGADLRARP